MKIAKIFKTIFKVVDLKLNCIGKPKERTIINELGQKVSIFEYKRFIGKPRIMKFTTTEDVTVGNGISQEIFDVLL